MNSIDIPFCLLVQSDASSQRFFGGHPVPCHFSVGVAEAPPYHVTVPGVTGTPCTMSLLQGVTGNSLPPQHVSVA